VGRGADLGQLDVSANQRETAVEIATQRVRVVGRLVLGGTLITASNGPQPVTN
jgi:hypothetical protein